MTYLQFGELIYIFGGFLSANFNINSINCNILTTVLGNVINDNVIINGLKNEFNTHINSLINSNKNIKLFNPSYLFNSITNIYYVGETEFINEISNFNYLKNFKLFNGLPNLDNIKFEISNSTIFPRVIEYKIIN